ncbi:helix-turn-helix domain-containing protein [Nocardia sp. NPDC051030]|uniref:helix-turn-helix domain-containing protein n=1 Tax=Nocardia sp. NPDC051030 TaxID=3155162 RepID=UPI00342EE8B9
MIGTNDLIPEQPVLAMYMRHRRETLGLTQEDVARRMFVSLSMYRKLESGERPLTANRLEDWCAAMNAPVWLLEKMVSLALPKLASVARGVWPPALRQEDLEHLESFPFPAYFHRFPEFEVLAANATARGAFTWLLPAPPDAERPTNLLEQMMTSPEAQEVLINWETIVHRLLFAVRVLAPGIVAPERLAQIVETCSANPEFERLWQTDMDEALFNDSLVLARDPATGARMSFTIRTYNVYHPENCAYQLFTLTPRGNDTPSVDPHWSRGTE